MPDNIVPRWVASFVARSPATNEIETSVHQFEEMDELVDLVEDGGNFHLIESIVVTIHPVRRLNPDDDLAARVVLEEEPVAVDTVPTNSDELADRILKYVVTVVGPEDGQPISAQTMYDQLEFDELDAAELVQMIEEEFGVTFARDDDLGASIADTVEYVRKRKLTE